jgi:hypothetical protein
MACLNFPRYDISTNYAREHGNISPIWNNSLKHKGGIPFVLNEDPALTDNNMRRPEAKLQVTRPNANLIELETDKRVQSKSRWNGSHSMTLLKSGYHPSIRVLNWRRKRTSFSLKSRRSGTPWRMMAIRSMPKPKA